MLAESGKGMKGRVASVTGEELEMFVEDVGREGQRVKRQGS